jgi:hypothetical protein
VLSTLLCPDPEPRDTWPRRSTRTSVMLFPKKLDQTDEVRECDLKLSQWVAELPPVCQYSNEFGVGNSASSTFVNRALLNMAYFTTLSALHRPQVLPSATTSKSDGSRELRDTSRRRSSRLHEKSLVFLKICTLATSRDISQRLVLPFSFRRSLSTS